MNRDTAAIAASGANAFTSTALARTRDAAYDTSRGGGLAAGSDETSLRFDERMTEARRAVEREQADARADSQREREEPQERHEVRRQDAERAAELAARARRESEHASHRREAARSTARPAAAQPGAHDAQARASHRGDRAQSDEHARGDAGDGSTSTSLSRRDGAAKRSRNLQDDARTESRTIDDGKTACADGNPAAEAPAADSPLALACSEGGDTGAAEASAAAGAAAADGKPIAARARRAAGVQECATGAIGPTGQASSHGATARAAENELAASGAPAHPTAKAESSDEAAAAAASPKTSAAADIEGGNFASQLARASSEASASTLGAAPAAQPGAAHGATQANASAAPVHTASVATPLGQPAFAERFATEVTVLASAGIERAQIQVQPPDLGPVQIDLTLDGESARIAFSAAQPLTRHAIEQSLPVLKDMLAANGLVLADANVSDGRQAFDGSGGASANAHANRAGPALTGPGAGPVTGHPVAVAAPRGLLDVYA